MRESIKLIDSHLSKKHLCVTVRLDLLVKKIEISRSTNTPMKAATSTFSLAGSRKDLAVHKYINSSEVLFTQYFIYYS